jgi:tripartite-type tricarboxylate transporter receptor subunit TctC
MNDDAATSRAPLYEPALDRRAALRLGATFAASVPALLAPGFAVAQQGEVWPARPIRLIVSYTAGSGADIIARYFAAAMQKSLGAPVVVENKPGAGGNIGTAAVASAAPDGYTLLVTPASPVTGNPLLYKDLPFKTEDFAPVAPLLQTAFALAVPASRNITSVAQLTDFVRQRKGAAKYGAPTSSSIAISAFYLDEIGASAVRVPYKAAQEALKEVEAGEIDFLFIDLTGVVGAIPRGKARVLAVTTNDRLKILPDLPTLREQGVTTANWESPFMALAPRNTPEPVLARLESVLQEISRQPETADFLKTAAGEPLEGGRAFLKTFIETQKAKWVRAIEVAKLERM